MTVSAVKLDDDEAFCHEIAVESRDADKIVSFVGEVTART